MHRFGEATINSRRSDKTFGYHVLVLCAALVLLATANALAIEAEKTIDCSNQPYSGRYTELYERAVASNRAICAELSRAVFEQDSVNDEVIRNSLRKFGGFAKNYFNTSDLPLVTTDKHHKEQFRALEATFSGFEHKSSKMPELRIQPNPVLLTTEAYFEPLNTDDIPRMTVTADKDCTIHGEKCLESLNDFGKAFGHYRAGYDSLFSADSNLNLLKELGSEWDGFLGVSKHQTVWEVALTTHVQRNHFKADHIVGPPDLQMIALHPRLVYSHSDAAVDGEQQSVGLAVEWIGFNFWKWKIPLGASIASVYVDRASTPDVGHGVMLHINNTYSIGWADHHGEDSFYVSLDLLKLFSDGKKTFGRYVGGD